MSATSDTATMLLSICDASEAVAPLLALAEVDRPTTWSPAPAMRASLTPSEAVPFAKKGVGYALMVASAPDPTGKVLEALVKFPQKSVWRRAARNSDCSRDAVLRLLSKDDKEVSGNVVQYTDPRFWYPWVESNKAGWITNLKSTLYIGSTSRWAAQSASRFLRKWSKEEALEFISFILEKPLGKTWVVEAVREASRGGTCVTVDEVLTSLPYRDEERFEILMAALSYDGELTDMYVNYLIECAPADGYEQRGRPDLPGIKGSDAQVLTLLAAASPYLKALAFESVLAHPGRYSDETLNAVISDDEVSLMPKSWSAVKTSYRMSTPEWPGFARLTHTTIDKVVCRSEKLDTMRNQSYGLTAPELSTGQYLSRTARKRLLAVCRVDDWVNWLCGEVPGFEPDFDLLIEMIQEYHLPEGGRSVDDVRKLLTSSDVALRYVRPMNGTSEEFHTEVLKLVDFLGRASLLYVSRNLTSYGSGPTPVLYATQEVIRQASPTPQAWSVIASLTPTWNGSISELVTTANVM